MFEKFKFAVSIIDLFEFYNFFLICLLATCELNEIFFSVKLIFFVCHIFHT